MLLYMDAIGTSLFGSCCVCLDAYVYIVLCMW